MFELILQNLSVNKVYNIPYEDHLLVVLMKLKLGLLNRDIGYRFNIKDTIISKIIRTWLPFLSNIMSKYIRWPSRASLWYNLPKSFRKFRNCVAIIDCSGVFIKRPLNTQARSQTWSNYKNNNTVKYLIGIAPHGAVTFISSGWGGRVSDREITVKSGFLNLLEPGDLVSADRGFNISQELAVKGATLKIPSFTKGKSQLAKKEVDVSRQFANVRIHVERVIGRLRKYTLLNTIIPISQVGLLNHAMISICGLINLNRAVVPK